MKEGLADLSRRYTLALKDYLLDGGEATLLSAYDLGRAALGMRLGVLDIAGLHQEALVSVLQSVPEKGQQSAKRAAEFFLEAIAPHEMSRRGELEANAILSEINRQLEERIRRQEEELDEKKRMERLKDEFISVVSHEFRTPLTSIHGSLGLLRAGVGGDEFSPKAQKLIELAKRSTERLVRLVNNMLDLQKISSDAFVLTLTPIEVKTLLEQALDANQAFAAQFGVNITLGDVCPAWLRVDVDRFTQVMTNLLSNAVKFSGRGEAVVVGASRQGGFVRVEVLDRGRGVPKEFRGRMFQKFAQADPSLSQDKRGSGLGLSIAKAIVERLEGRIGFEDRQGGGTAFFLDFPEWHGEARFAAVGGGK